MGTGTTTMFRFLPISHPSRKTVPTDHRSLHLRLQLLVRYIQHDPLIIPEVHDGLGGIGVFLDEGNLMMENPSAVIVGERMSGEYIQSSGWINGNGDFIPES